jgi:hypothetical protein
MDDGYRCAVQEAKRYKSLLPVTEPIVFIRGGKTSKYLTGIGKVKAMLLQVGRALRLIPLVPH